MAVKRLILNFPAHLVDQPVTYKLIKKFDLRVNILRARITPREEGKLMVEISGKKSKLEAGLRYLAELGLAVQSLAQEVNRRQERCIECGACVSICPSGALAVERPTMHVSFFGDKCIACELCVPACPYKAMEILF
ncbi:NIL domain-containing protein [Desulfoferrobacter suflitae]|uniref:NIL domain-containing protein n=1 Tax=Desulfoferrobacter suflitae TaxID=2865782 RepID=UPI0021643D3A|nr:NIL domain-containing protein [Desulfoferrobacter suflitae]MCK8604250.1 4Fe-4S binding protein [Desulfoferrobacter suflitae]